jgi:hypothetical protein
MPAQSNDHDPVQGGVGLAVAATVQAMRTVLPDETGIGEAAHSMENAASLGSRFGLAPAATNSAPAISGPTPHSWRSLGPPGRSADPARRPLRPAQPQRLIALAQQPHLRADAGEPNPAESGVKCVLASGAGQHGALAARQNCRLRVLASRDRPAGVQCTAALDGAGQSKSRGALEGEPAACRRP